MKLEVPSSPSCLHNQLTTTVKGENTVSHYLGRDGVTTPKLRNTALEGSSKLLTVPEIITYNVKAKYSYFHYYFGRQASIKQMGNMMAYLH